MSEQTIQQEAQPVSDGNTTPSEELFNRDIGLTELLKLTGRNKSQISKDTNSGRLPSTRNEQGHRRYQVRDVYQLYGFRQPKPTEQKTAKEQPKTTGENPDHKIAILQQQVQSQTETIRLLEKHTATLEQTILRLLPAPPPAASIVPATSPAAIMPAEPQAAAAPPARKSLLQRIFNL